MVSVQALPAVETATATPRAPRRWLGPALAVGAGAAMLLAFPPYGLWWLAPVGVALLALATRGRRPRAGFGLGLLSGIVLFGPLLAWTNLHVGYAPWVLLTLFQACYVALLGAALAWVSPVADRWRASWPLIIALLWVAQEALRGRAPFGGFPWGRLAFSQGDSPVLSFAAYGGAPLVTFVVALAGGLLALAMRAPWRSLNGPAKSAVSAVAGPEGADSAGARTKGAVSARTRGAVSAEGVAVGVAAFAVMAIGLIVPVHTAAGSPVVVAIVQGNVPRMGFDFNQQRRAVLDNHVQATVDLADRVRAGEVKQPDLVIWPENASDIDPLRNTDARAVIDSAARAINAPILVGAVLSGPGKGQSRNAGIVWLPDTGDDQMYLKRHPVPFAEYMPMRPIVEPIAQAITNQAKLLRTDFVAGAEPGVLTMGPVKVGDVICFEVAYDGVVRDVVTHGAQLIAVQTNNATFNEAEAAQQMGMVRLRAVEHGRDSLMASTVGISGFVTADGTVHDASGFNTAAVMVRELHAGESTTLATRLGAWPEAALTLLALAVLVLAAILRRRRDVV